MGNPNDKLDSLLNQYMTNKITDEEFRLMKREMNVVSDSEVEQMLRSRWSAHDKRSMDRFDDVRLSAPKLGERRKIGPLARVSRIAAAILLPLLVVGAFLVRDTMEQRMLDSRISMVQTANGERSSVVLPDGSVVYLNSATGVEYNANFDSRNRFVKLNGEAFFEVEKNLKREFVVETCFGMRVVVTGTKFNISSYEADNFTEISLVEGSVKVSSLQFPNREIAIKPNQKIVMNNSTGAMNIEESDMVYETAWRNNELVFRSAKFDDVIKKLEVYYGQTIEVDGVASDELFTGRFREDRLANVLKILQMHYNFTFDARNGIIYIKLR